MIDYEEEWLFPLLFKCSGSVALRASLFAVPSAILGVLLLYLDEWVPGFREDTGLMDIGASHIWNAVTAMAGILMGFRTRQALSRFWEGTGLLHQMRGEWFDTVSNCITFSISAKKTKPLEVNKFRHTIVRLMSLAHGSALEEIAGDQVQLDTIDVFGLDEGTLRHLKICHEKYKFNKVEVMLHLVQSLITDAQDNAVLKVPPPILSRVYQTISRGFVNLLNAKKITDTRFPFPYSQLITILLFILTVLTPMILTTAIKSKVLAACIVFVPIFAMYSLDFIAIELENPFGVDTNDLPLEHFQSEMNNCLLMLLHTNTDLIATTSPDCMMDFDELYKEIVSAELEQEEAGADGTIGRRKTRLSHFKDMTLNEDGTCSYPPGAGCKASLVEGANLQEKDGSKEMPPPEMRPGGEGKAAAPMKSPPKDVTTPRAPITTADVIITPNPSAKPEAMPTTESKATSDLQPLIAKSMHEFNVTMQNWTKVIEKQVAELDRNCTALQTFNDSLATNGKKIRGPGENWEDALPGV
mmetsp:Transcript_42637/g.76457  ORF Transcript_42637/g.76457 Transcript_42637/m.76457 type:complete len:526 (-) Transcript_42637:123-1700(-)